MAAVCDRGVELVGDTFLENLPIIEHDRRESTT